MKRTFSRMDILLSVASGGMLVLGLGLLVVVPTRAITSFLCAAVLLGLVFWPDIKKEKEGST